jgi:putative ABC transport system ATP-binding protein
MFGPNSPSRVPGHEMKSQAPADALSIENEPGAEKSVQQLTVVKETTPDETDSTVVADDSEQAKAKPKEDVFARIIAEELEQAQGHKKEQKTSAPQKLPDAPKKKAAWILKLVHVFKTYGRGRNCVKALKDVNMTIPRGRMVGVVGPSGSGKSTLLHVLSGMDIPDESEFSHVLYTYYNEPNDLNVGEIEYWDPRFMDSYRRSSVGVIFQRPNLFMEMSAWKNVAVSLAAQGFSLREVREKCAEMLEFVNMEEHTNRKPRNMSGGEQQRVAVARALVKAPALIVADEPTGNLDKKNTRIIMELLKTAQLEKGSTVILVTHNESLVAKYCDIAFRFTDTGVVGLDNEICSRRSSIRETRRERGAAG